MRRHQRVKNLRRLIVFCALALACAAPLASARVLSGLYPDLGPFEGDTSGGKIVTFSPPDPTWSVTCSPASGSLFPVGPTTVTCSGTDAGGGSVDGSFTVTVQDTLPPTFTSGPSGTTASTSGATADVNYVKPTANDLVDGSVAVDCTPPPGAFSIGTTHVDCTASDTRSHSATTGFDVVVTDIGNPTIAVVPPAVTEATGPGGASVSYTVTATDNSGVAPSIDCAGHNSGSTFPIGATPVTCTATDGAVPPNSATAPSFDVTVQDTTAPQLSLPGNLETEADSTSGKVVTFSATASDTVAGGVAVTCAPTSGSTFPFGTTTVNCSATDGHNPVQGSFTVTVTDHTGPAFTGVPPDRQVEANGPAGSVVNFSTPTATDTLDGPIAGGTCTPVSGSQFPLGTTTVTCSATDSHGNLGTASFLVTVADTTPPALYTPADRSIVATSAAGLPSSSPAVAAFLAAARAVDIVDPHPIVIYEVMSFLPVGVNTVTFEARDAGGNKTVKTATLTVLPVGSAPVPTPPERKPPAEVTKLTAVGGDGSVRLTWQIPAGVDQVVVKRSGVGAAGEVVFSGRAGSYIDRGLTNGTEYRYVITTVDAAGNTSAGVAAVVIT